LRLLNGSNSRIYKLAWHDRSPLTVIGTDGGLLNRTVSRDFVMLAPGERIEIWVDFSERKKGSEMTLQSLTFSGSGHSMHGGMGGRMVHGMGRGMMGHGGDMRRGRMDGTSHSALPAGSAFPVMRFRISRDAVDHSSPPKYLTPEILSEGCSLLAL